MAGKIAGKIDRVLNEVSVELTEEERVEFYRCLTLISNRLDILSQRDHEEENP